MKSLCVDRKKFIISILSETLRELARKKVIFFMMQTFCEADSYIYLQITYLQKIVDKKNMRDTMKIVTSSQLSFLFHLFKTFTNFFAKLTDNRDLNLFEISRTDIVINAA